MKGLFIDPYLLKPEELGAKRLQEILVDVINNYVKARCPYTTETKSHSSFDFEIIKGNNGKELQWHLNMVLYNKNIISLHFREIRRDLLIQWVHSTEKRKGSVRLIFYKSTPEHPDKRLQTITREVILSTKILALVK